MESLGFILNRPGRRGTEVKIRKMKNHEAAGPLQGIKVLDFSSFIAGSYTAMTLGDLGASVIKVEPLTGDLARAWSPFLAGESRYFQGWNRNKRSIALDLTQAPAREIVYKLAAAADVSIENFRRGVTTKLKIDYETLRELNARLIYCSSTAFGSRGPDRDRPGYDPLLQCLSGAARANTRFNGGTVAISSVAATDYQAAMLLSTAISAALYHRERTGVGQKIETSLLQAAISVQSHFFIKALEREEEGGLGIYPYRLFDTKDDVIFIAAGTDRFWRLLCEAIGLSDLASDPPYATNAQRVCHPAELTARLQPVFLEKTTAEWEAILLPAGVPAASAKTYQQFFVDPQVEAMEMNPVIEHPVIGPMRVAGIPFNFEKTPGAIQSPAPTLGQHTDEILREVGYDDAGIAGLRSSRCVA